VNVAAVVVTHTPDSGIERCLTSLDPQVDELVVVQNVPLDQPAALPGLVVLTNDRPVGLSANLNRGIAATTAPWVVIANPDTVADSGAVEVLHTFAAGHPRAGVLGPRLRTTEGAWQPSRRRFPTVSGTLVRRTPLRALLKPQQRQRAHYLLDEDVGEPVRADWLLGAFLLLRRSMLDELGGFDEGFRLYGEEIDLCYRAAKAGWERWYVPAASVVHRSSAVTDRRFLTRHTLWHMQSIARFVRKHPERLRAL
jgi:N-acetylglucosaminyl-diphospho-decaprenol L-rhamnosyltransferase